ncbi:MAG: PHP-associated domain-containing protein [Promethearchaeia archaeon]
MAIKYSIEEFGAVFDAHIHSYFDLHDGLLSPRDFIKCTKKKGFNYVCAMAHDTVEGAGRIKKEAKEANLPCISAIEVSTNYNHILAYGVNEWPYRRDTIDPDIAIEYLREQGCAIFLAHPYSNPHQGLWVPEVVKRLDIDGIEWTNGTIYHQNIKTHKVYSQFPTGRRIAGSDAHSPETFGCAFTQVAVNSEDPDDLVAAMKTGKCSPYSANAPLHQSLQMVLKSVFWNSILKRRWIEGHLITPIGDHPGSIVPDKIKTRREWLRKILKQPVIPRVEKWIEG